MKKRAFTVQIIASGNAWELYNDVSDDLMLTDILEQSEVPDGVGIKKQPTCSSCNFFIEMGGCRILEIAKNESTKFNETNFFCADHE